MKDKAKLTNKKLAGYLKIIRNEEGLTMRALADIIDTQHSFVGKIEKQSRRLDVGEFIHYCEAMNQNPKEVLKAILDLQ